MTEIMRCVFGSHLYGLQTPNSDTDYNGLYLPDKDSLLLGNYRKHFSESTGTDRSKNSATDVDVEIFSLPYFIDLACKGETVAIDMLHAESCRTRFLYDRIWHDLKANRKRFYTKDMKSYVGYARKQANKYGIKGSRMAAVEQLIDAIRRLSPADMTGRVGDTISRLPMNEFLRVLGAPDRGSPGGVQEFYEVCGRKYAFTLSVANLYKAVEGIYQEYGDRAKQAKLNEGVDWKAVSHALRASYQMLGILRDGDFEYPLPQTKFLLQVKQGQLNFVEEVQPALDRAIQEIEGLAAMSTLPETVDREYWDNWLLGVYEEYLF